MIGFLFSFLSKIRGMVLYVGLLYVMMVFFYNYLSIWVDVAIYHVVMAPVVFMFMIGWSYTMLYGLFLIVLFPDILRLLKYVINKLS